LAESSSAPAPPVITVFKEGGKTIVDFTLSGLPREVDGEQVLAAYLKTDPGALNGSVMNRAVLLDVASQPSLYPQLSVRVNGRSFTIKVAN
jgi:hypothetical protein